MSMSYTTPPITTLTTTGPLASYSAIQQAPALLTRFSPPYSCQTDWFWDTGVLRESPTVFSDAAHNTAFATCQPYSVAGGMYSAGVCPEMSEFKSVTKMTWAGVGDDEPHFFMGACCGTDSKLSSYKTAGMEDSIQACFGTAAQSTVTATMVQENLTPTLIASKGPITVVAEPMYIVWHEDDVSVHAEADSNSLRAAMGMALAASTASPIPSSTSPPAQEGPSAGNQLATGAIVGIAIGFAVCISLLAFMVGLMLIRRRKRKAKRAGGAKSGGAGEFNSHRWAQRSDVEIDSRNVPSEADDTEMKTPQFYELHAIESPRSVRFGGGHPDACLEQKTLIRGK